MRQPEGIQVDPSGKLPGRGAYLHDLRSCWERGLKGPLSAALKVELRPEDRQRLETFMQTIMDEEPTSEAAM